MLVFETLNAIQELLIRKVGWLDRGNTVVTVTGTLVPQQGRRYAQIYYNGSNPTNWSGGNLFRKSNVGIRTYERLIGDSLNQRKRQAGELICNALDVTRVLHLRYDLEEIPLAEPIRLEGESAIREIPDDPAVMFIEQTFMLETFFVYDQVRGGGTARTPH